MYTEQKYNENQSYSQLMFIHVVYFNMHHIWALCFSLVGCLVVCPFVRMFRFRLVFGQGSFWCHIQYHAVSSVWTLESVEPDEFDDPAK